MKLLTSALKSNSSIDSLERYARFYHYLDVQKYMLYLDLKMDSDFKELAVFPYIK